MIACRHASASTSARHQTLARAVCTTARQRTLRMCSSHPLYCSSLSSIAGPRLSTSLHESYNACSDSDGFESARATRSTNDDKQTHTRDLSNKHTRSQPRSARTLKVEKDVERLRATLERREKCAHSTLLLFLLFVALCLFENVVTFGVFLQRPMSKQPQNRKSFVVKQ